MLESINSRIVCGLEKCMRRFLKILSAFLAGCLMLSACGDAAAPANGDGDENDGKEEEVIEEVKENVEDAKEFMAGFEAEIKCPVGYTIMKTETDYGEIVKTKYDSKTCGRERNVNIVLPAGYSEDKKYPVLYVLHGIFGDENSMLGDGNSGARVIIGNLVAEGLAKEMIIVFPNMYASTDPNQAPAFDAESVKPYDNFVNDLVDDLMPFMEANYSVATGKKNTAVLGFSMGGRESLAIGIAHPDKFGYIGAIAPAPGLVPGQDWAMKHEGTYTEDQICFPDNIMPWMLMICAGDKDGTVGQFPKSYHELMDKNGVAHVWYEIPGSDHGDPAISSGIYNFAKYAFTVE